MNKAQAIKPYEIEIEKLAFKIDAYRLKIKFAKNVSDIAKCSLEICLLIAKARAYSFQIQLIQSQPTPQFKKGLAVINSNRNKEIIIKR